MFKHCLKFISIFLVYLSHSILCNDMVTLAHACTPDFSKTSAEDIANWGPQINARVINDGFNIMFAKSEALRRNKDMQKLSELNCLIGLIGVLGVRDTDCIKFYKAVQIHDLEGILSSLKFDVTNSNPQAFKDSPNVINTAIDVLQFKINELNDYNILLEINEILIKEIENFEQNNDQINSNLLKHIHSNLHRRYEKIAEKGLILEKIKNKDWQAALKLTKDPNRWKDKLCSKAINVLHNEMFIEKQKNPNGESLNKLKKLLHKVGKKGTSGKNWEEIARAIKGKDWNNAMKFARIC